MLGFWVVFLWTQINFNLAGPILDEERKLTLIFIFTLLSGASKGFMKGLFKAP